MNILRELYQMTAFGPIMQDPGVLLMLLIGFVLLYLGITKKYEPLLLVPIAFGLILANLPGGGMGVVPAEMIELEDGRYLNLFEIASRYGIMNYLYYALIKTGFIPPIIFMGVGALTDFGPMLRNLRLAFFGAAAQIGIFSVIFGAVAMGFSLQEAGSLGIIGGADGPTAIYTTIMLAPHLLGPVAIAAYSYMALVPVIIPLIANMMMSKSEFRINMKQQDKLHPPKYEIKNLKLVKILFPIILGVIVAIFVPSSVPLLGMLLFGNLIKEVGTITERLSNAATGPIMNTATIFLGLAVGGTMTADVFLDMRTMGIIIGGFLAFAISIAGGITAVKVYNIFAKKKINPLIGATGLSAVPMASRVANDLGLKHDPGNHLLQYCMASNISGVIGSAVAAGVLISMLT